MASVQAVEKLSSMLKVIAYDFDYAADPVDVAWVNMRDVEHFMAVVFRSVGTGDIDGFKLLANPNSDGSGTDVEVKAASASLIDTADAVGDQVFLECSASELAALGSNLLYLSANLELETSTDECVVIYVMKMKHQKSGQTAAIIA